MPVDICLAQDQPVEANMGEEFWKLKGLICLSFRALDSSQPAFMRGPPKACDGDAEEQDFRNWRGKPDAASPKTQTLVRALPQPDLQAVSDNGLRRLAHAAAKGEGHDPVMLGDQFYALVEPAGNASPPLRHEKTRPRSGPGSSIF
ncbi:hypothetical protein ACLJYM_13790 [Rhizobium giardinii]|uniref:hypothetical protein n=1 Tax=Rhizobium giardinii TaxID=56731 RepID=UPI0013AFB73D